MKDIDRNEYNHFIKEIKKKIYKAQYEALKQVNKELIRLYWEIGKSIVERQEKYGWGKSIVENLAKDIQGEFPGVQGYSTDNLWRMRKFYLNYQDNTKLAPMVQEISWSHNVVIMEKCKDELEREFYIKMTRNMGGQRMCLSIRLKGKPMRGFYLIKPTLIRRWKKNISIRPNWQLKTVIVLTFWKWQRITVKENLN